MTINDRGIQLIKQFEGLELKAYRCPAGLLTIGYGHTGKDVTEDLEIDEAQAEELLRKDLERFERGVSKLLRVPVTSNEFSALVSFAYNCGLMNLKASTLLRKLNAGERDADQFLRWDMAGGVKLKGLTRRRKAERDLFLS